MTTTHAPQRKLIVIEGNIGTGKSTLLDILHQTLKVNLIPEPTSKWQQVGQTENLLHLFYKDTPRWAYTFQSYAFLTRIHTIIEHLSQNDTQMVHVLERSVYCDRFCFAKNCYESGDMTALEWHIYKEWFLWLVENFTPRPSGFVYLRTEPEVSHQRILKRHRHEETGIPLSYLKALHNKHDDWLLHKKEGLNSLRDIPVLVLDCNKDFQADEAERDKLISAITNFIETLPGLILPKNTHQKTSSYL